MKKCLALFVLFFSACGMFSQRVGLVMSGGGARGVAHIGLIQALEDNDIPIDYITGTSMGAVVGSMYAMGYTTDEMVALLKSDEFYLWQTGRINDDFIDFYKRKDFTPDFFTLNTSFDQKGVKRKFLPNSLINPLPMNFAFLKLFASATIRCNYDFDNLFVPLRAVASDIYNKQPVIMRSGELGDAVRASMTFPFVFKPIRINGVLAYDGGIYNNFPVDVMEEDFAPEFMIGSVVSENPKMPDEDDLMGQIENMVMQKTDYTIDSIKGVCITFDVMDVSLLDFEKADEIYKIGYDKGLEYVAEIKSRVERRAPKEEVQMRRLQYVSQNPVITFTDVIVEGTNNLQAKYIEDQFKIPEGGVASIDDVERSYFGLLSDKKVTDIMPSVVPNGDGTFSLKLKVKLNQDVETSLGGMISSMNANRFYMGWNYRIISLYAIDLDLNLQLGKSYNSVLAQARMDLPHTRKYLLGRFAYTGQRYYESEKLFSMDESPCFIEQREGYGLLEIGRPIGTKIKMTYGGGYALMNDYYYQSNTSNFSDTDPDHSRYKLWQAYAGLEFNKITVRDYPTRGYRHLFKFRYVGGNDANTYLDASGAEKATNSNDYNWVEFRYSSDIYFNPFKKFAWGFSSAAVFSTKPLLANYSATLIQSPAYAPIDHSKVVFKEAYRSNNYVAVGLKPIWKINDMFQLRGEFYAFQPLQMLKSDSQNNAQYESFSFSTKYISQVSGVMQLPFASIALFANNYTAPKSEWNFGITIGYVINTPKFLD